MIASAIVALVAIAAITAYLIARSRSGRASRASRPVADESGIRDEAIRAGFDRFPLAMAYINAAGRWIDVNPKLLAELGYTRSELSRTPLRLITHPDDRKEESSLLSELRSGRRESYMIRKRVRRKSGEYRTYRVQMLRCLESPTPVYQCILDHSEHEETSLERIAAATLNLEQPAVILCDGNGLITSWNRGAERLFGFREVDVLGRKWMSMHLDSARGRAILTSSARSGQTTTASTRTHADGSTVEVEGTVLSDTRFREATSFLEICHSVSTAAASDTSSAESSVPKEIAVEALPPAQAAHDEKDAAEDERIAELARLTAANAELTAANAELTRKLGLLTRGVRRMAEAKEEARQAMSAGSTQAAVEVTESPDWSEAPGSAIANTIRALAAETKSGRLIWTAAGGGAERRLIFDRGQIAGCSESGSDEPLGQFLLNAGVITEKQRRAALEAHLATGLPMGTSLIRMGFTTRDEIENAVRTRSARMIADAVRHDRIRHAFVEQDLPVDRRVSLTIDVSSVLEAQETEPIEPSEQVPAGAAGGRPEDQQPAEDQQPPEEQPPEYIARAGSRSRVYHLPGCQAARGIPGARRITFETAAAAGAAGYRPCGRCIRGA